MQGSIRYIYNACLNVIGCMLASLALALCKPTSLVPPPFYLFRRLETRSERRRVASKAEDDGKDEVPPRWG